MSGLKEKIIRLAYKKPELRKHLLPLVTSSEDTFKCPECGTKVLEKTGYCVKCEEKVKKAGFSLESKSDFSRIREEFEKIGIELDENLRYEKDGLRIRVSKNRSYAGRIYISFKEKSVYAGMNVQDAVETVQEVRS